MSPTTPTDKTTTDAAPDGSITRRQAPRTNLLAFEIRAKISKTDIEWMAESVDAAFDAHDEVDMLIIMTNYDGQELGAAFSGEATAIQMRSLGHVRRYAVVGAPGWASAIIEMFGKLSPVESKTFDFTEEKAAWEWVDRR